jgi:hypothetical protein
MIGTAIRNWWPLSAPRQPKFCQGVLDDASFYDPHEWSKCQSPFDASFTASNWLT